MRKNVKKNLIALCSVIALGALTATGVNAINANALTTADVAGNFYVVDGASVLYKAQSGEEAVQAGIRFQAVMTEEYYAVATGTTVTYGVELYSALNNTLLTDVDCSENVVLSEKAYTQNGTEQYKAYLFNAAVTYGELEGEEARLAYAFDIYAKAYVNIDGTKTYAATNQSVRSMNDVAYSAYNDEKAETYQNEDLAKYFQNVTEATEKSIVAKLPDEADDKQVVIAGLEEDAGAKKVYVGGTELTGATVVENAVILSDEDAGKVTLNKNYALTVLSDSGKTYSATFSGITKYLDTRDFVTVMGNTTYNVAENYFMLDGDVNLTEADYGVQVAGYYFVVRDMRSTLDGNGYAITVNAYAPAKKLTTFRDVWDTCVLKNLNFTFNATTQVDVMSSALGMYVTQGATVETSYLEANVVPVDNKGGLVDNVSLSMLYQIANKDASPTIINNLLVNMNVVGGTGYFSMKPIGNVWIKNLAMIGTSETPVLTVNTQAVLYEDNNYYYTSIEDFIAGTNGKVCEIKFARNEPVWNDATKVAYANWSDVWSIKDGEIKLNGTKVNTELPERTVTATMNGSTLTTTDTSVLTAYEVYAGETLVDTITGSCEVSVGALEKAGAIKAGENEIVLTVKTAIGKEVVATVDGTLKVFGMDQTNFVATASTAQAAVKSDYTYIMCGDVMLGVNDFGTYKVSWHAVGTLFVPFDGNGHTLAVEGNLNVYKSVNGLAGYPGSVFYDVQATVKNLVFRYNVTRSASLNDTKNGCFATNIVDGVGHLYNCYMEANVTPVDADGNVVAPVDDVTMMFWVTRYTSTVKGCLFSVNVLDKDGNALTGYGSLVYKGNGNTGFKYCAFIHANETPHIAKNGYSNIEVWNFHYYTSIANFLTANGKVLNEEAKTALGNANITAESWVTPTATIYSKWDNVWTIDQTGIKLCGVTVYTVPAQA